MSKITQAEVKKHQHHVLTIAGYDPCGGAGLLQDIRVFQDHGINAQGVCTAMTFQNEARFVDVQWMSAEDILRQLELLREYSDFSFIKIGLVESGNTLLTLLEYLRVHFPQAFIIWDPILKASAGYAIHSDWAPDVLENILKKIDLLTPNTQESSLLMRALFPALESRGLVDQSPMNVAHLSEYCGVLEKGGHRPENHPVAKANMESDAEENSVEMCTDFLYSQQNVWEFSLPRIPGAEKHGTGCVLSAAILSNLSLAYELPDACRRARAYMQAFLSSGEALLGFAHGLTKLN